MATDICIRRLTKELRTIKKDPIQSPKITVAPNESNILEMHYVIEGGSKTPYEGGIYWGKLIFPKEYPLKPPGVMMITPSGRFQPNRRLCLSMSDFHPETWNPMWSVSTILTGLYSFMIENSPTMGSIETKALQKVKFAEESLAFNVRDPQFRKLFPEYVKLHEERVAAQRETTNLSNGEEGSSLQSSITTQDPATAGVAQLGGNPAQVQGMMTTLTGIAVAIISIVFALRYL